MSDTPFPLKSDGPPMAMDGPHFRFPSETIAICHKPYAISHMLFEPAPAPARPVSWMPGASPHFDGKILDFCEVLISRNNR